MRFGIFSVADHYPAELPRNTRQLYDELMEQVVAADEWGFSSFWVAEHHFHEYGAIPRPSLWLAAAAQRTRSIRLGAAVVTLPFDNPLRAAEDYAMVDVISGGRLSLGVGSGYLEHEFNGFGIDGREKRQRFDECLEIMLRAWSGEKFSFNGAYHNISNVALNVIPLQRPHPPVSIAVLRNEAAPFVGRKQLPMMMIPYASMDSFDELSKTVRQFKDSFLQAGGQLENATVHFGLHAYCSDTTDGAKADVKEAMDRYVRTRLYAKQRSFETLVEKKLVAFGDPQEIIDVARTYEAAGLTDFLIIANFGGLPHRKVLDSLEQIARHVLPEFRKLPLDTLQQL
jgi:alkanesulfonate monooxygenase SsuD/methylene tetrahydromethanopterin reductase-like flavin-dependent oxidoreductase (luciferase family)